MAKREHFSEIVEDNGVSFTVRGEIDCDGLPVIDTVEVGQDIQNIWVCIEPGYRSKGSLGDRLYEAVKEIITERAAANESWRYEEVAA